MAQEDVTITVTVTDKGTVIKTVKGVKELSDSTKDLTDSTEKGSKASKDFFDRQAKGVAGTANSTRSFSKLAQTMGEGGGVVGAYATLAANIFAVSAAFNALRNAAQVEQVLSGLELAGARVGRTLTVVAQDLRDITNGALSTEQSLRAVAQVSSAGFGADAMRDLTQAAFDTSVALGRNLSDSMDRITRGVIKLEPELLDELGIMTKLTESNAAYAASLGKNVSQLTAFEKRQGYLNAVIGEAELKFGGISEAAGDAAAFDQLAATFVDLTNAIMNFINVAAIPLAAVFAQGPTALLGGMLLFASTIKGQLLPGLTGLAQKSIAAAAAKKQLAQVEQRAAKAVLENVQAENLRGLATKKAALTNDIGSKKFREYIEGVKSGKSVLEGQKEALTSLSRSETAYQNQINKGVNVEAATAAIEKIKEQRAAIDEVKKAEEVGVEATAEQIEKVKAAREGASRAAKASNAERLAGIAAESAASGNYARAMSAYTRSVMQFYRSQMVGGGRVISMFGAMRLAAFAVVNAVKLITIAFLNLLPYIGLITIGIGLLQSAWEWMKSDATKATERAAANFDAVATQTGRAATELQRIETSAGTLADRTVQALTIQSNAVQELTAAYEELIKNRREAEEDGPNGISGVATLWDQFQYAPKRGASSPEANPNSDRFRDQISYNNDLDRASLAFQKNLSNLDPMGSVARGLGTGTFEQEFVPVIRTLGELEKILPAATKETINFNEEITRISEVEDANQQLEQNQALIRKVAQVYAGAAQNIAELKESFATANLAFGEFTRSLAQSTGYDKVVDSLRGVSTSIANIEDSLATGVIGLEGWTNALSGIGPDMLKYLEPVDAQLISTVNSAQATVNALVQVEETMGSLTVSQQASLTSARAELAVNVERLPVIAEAVRVLEAQFKEVQNMERVTKSIIALEQARLSVMQELYTASAAGVAARIDGENRIKALQISMLAAQKAIIDASMLQSEIELQRLATLLEITGALQQQDIILAQQAVSTANIALTSLETAARAVGVTSENFEQLSTSGNVAQRSFASALIATIAIKNAAEENLGNMREYQAIEGNLAEARATSVSLANQMAAISVTITNSQERSARMAEKIVEINQENLDIIQQSEDAYKNIATQIRRQEALLTGRVDTLAYQLREVTEELNKSVVDLNRARDQEVTSLETSINTLEALASRDAALSAAGIAVLRTKIGLINESTEARIAEARAISQTRELELVLFDSRKEGLEWQKQGLDLIQQQIDAQRELSTAAEAYFAAQRRLYLRRRGLEETEAGQESAELRAARTALETAIQEAGIKKAIIELEFYLIDAQRQLLLEQITERRNRLEAINDNGTYNTEIAQATAAMENLSRDFSAILRSRIEAINVDILTKMTEVATLETPRRAASDTNRRIEEANDLQRLYEERRTSTTSTPTTIPVIAPTVVDRSAELEALERRSVANDAAIARNRVQQTQTVAAINAAGVQANTAQAAATAAASSAQAGVWSIEAATEIAEEAGARVTELLGRGNGVAPRRYNSRGELIGGHRSNGHYEGRSFDLNMGPQGNSERTDPAINARMDALAENYRELGYQVLWEVAGHYEHMHVEITNAMIAQQRRNAATAAASTRRSTVATVAAAVNSVPPAVTATTPTERATPSAPAVIEQDMPARPGEDIVVTAARPTSRENLRPDPIVEPPKMDTGLVASLPSMPDVTSWGTNFDLVLTRMAQFEVLTEGMRENLASLGPEGEAVLALVTGMEAIAKSAMTAINVFADPEADFADKFTAAASVAMAAISTIQSFLNASSQARIANIDEEIAAEQRRDGKSAASVEKLRALEKKKDSIARKQFNTNKKLMMAQAVISTATGIAAALQYGPLGIPLAVLIGALGAAQLAIIAGTSYQSASTSGSSVSTPGKLTIGKIGDSVDLAKQNSNPGGELGYLRGNKGIGSNSSNYRVIGSAYGSDNMLRGYGSSAFVVGEKGPEIITPETPISVTPVNDNEQGGKSVQANFTIQALDARGVEDLLRSQKGNIISMIREAANSSGQRFLEDVKVETYSRPNVGRI